MRKMTVKEIASRLRKYRTALMGIAILWVYLFHTSWNVFEPLYTLIHKGYGGVDIFFFLSGFGIFFALEKSSSILDFYKRRIRKIYPAFLITLFALFVLRYRHLRMEGVPKKELLFSFFANVFTVSYFKWTVITFNWYIFAILNFYLLSPVFHEIIVRKGGPLLLILSLPLNILFFGDFNHLIASSRLFLYLLGMETAYLSMTKPDLRVSGKILIGLMGIGVVILLLVSRLPADTLDYYGLWWYPFMAITPGLLYCLILLFNKTGRDCFPVLELFGKASLELYLLNVSFKDYVFAYVARFTGWTEWVWPIGLLIMGITGIVFHFVLEKTLKLIRLA